jgi:hypothetical protein
VILYAPDPRLAGSWTIDAVEWNPAHLRLVMHRLGSL